ncbi:hypothetical protein OUZ56_019717 [Daphnia magna]|uniref:Uncharacterized protein n=1 Tax=Daphnia magna TaxID=35525 RepID=A0ABQ9ZCD9_9CRUS|nr:hypothetical protein OUZ56_019717 [Daphnia magna]
MEHVIDLSYEFNSGYRRERTRVACVTGFIKSKDVSWPADVISFTPVETACVPTNPASKGLYYVTPHRGVSFNWTEKATGSTFKYRTTKFII